MPKQLRIKRKTIRMAKYKNKILKSWIESKEYVNSNDKWIPKSNLY
jgi:hypothetical protein